MEALAPTAEAEDSAREVWGLYEASQGWRWSLFCPQKGDVVVVKIPLPIAEDESTYGAFVMTEKVLLSDGSLSMTVKSLGSTDQAVTQSLSKMFNRRVGMIHCCHGEEDCMVTEDVAFHCRTVELCNGETFAADYAGQSGKRLLRQVRQDLVEEMIYSPEKEAVPAGHRPEEKEKAPMNSQREKGGSPAEVTRHSALRQRLEETRKRRGKGGEAPEKEAPEITQGDPAQKRPRDNQRPQLSSSYRLPSGGEMGQALTWSGLQEMRTAEGEPADTRERTTRALSSGRKEKSVGSQLMLRAAAHYQPPTGGGNLPPTGGGWDQPPGGEKRKKKKRKRARRRARRRRRAYSPVEDHPEVEALGARHQAAVKAAAVPQEANQRTV